MTDKTFTLPRAGGAMFSVELKEENHVTQESDTTTATNSVSEATNPQVSTTIGLEITKADPAIADGDGNSQIDSHGILYDPPTVAPGGSDQKLNEAEESRLPSRSTIKNTGDHQKIDMLAASVAPTALREFFDSEQAKLANATTTLQQRAEEHVVIESATITAPSITGETNPGVPVELNITTTYPTIKEGNDGCQLFPQHKFTSFGGSNQKPSSADESQLKPDSATKNRVLATSEAKPNSGDTKPAPEPSIHFIQRERTKSSVSSDQKPSSTEESHLESGSPPKNRALTTCEVKIPPALIHYVKSESAKPPNVHGLHSQQSRPDSLHTAGQLEVNRLPQQSRIPATNTEESKFQQRINPTDTQEASDMLLSLQNIAFSGFSKQKQLANSPVAATPTAQSNAGVFDVYKEALEKSIQPTYVNARQYPRILIRRETRAILEAHYEKKASIKRKGGYNYESRHLHSMKRPRNSKGQYLTKDELVEYYKLHPDEAPKIEQRKPPEDKSDN